MVVSNHFHSVKKKLFSSIRSRDFDGMYTALDFRCQCTQHKLQSICAVLTFDPQLKNILAFSVKHRYQLNYFICINYFFNIKCVFFFICGCQHHERKTICLYLYISDIRQRVRYRAPVYILLLLLLLL